MKFKIKNRLCKTFHCEGIVKRFKNNNNKYIKMKFSKTASTGDFKTFF